MAREITEISPLRTFFGDFLISVHSITAVSLAMEIYSGYDPAWRFVHCPDYWIKKLEDEGILASAGELFKGCHSALGYVPEWQIDIYLR